MAAPIGQQHNLVDDDLGNIPEGPSAEVADGLDTSVKALIKTAIRMIASKIIDTFFQK